jgi:predicted RNA binding protein YcfA (HicA-like mRNA interferase family)
MGYVPVDRTGSHLKLRYVHPETDETRTVSSHSVAKYRLERSGR